MPVLQSSIVLKLCIAHHCKLYKRQFHSFPWHLQGLGYSRAIGRRAKRDAHTTLRSQRRSQVPRRPATARAQGSPPGRRGSWRPPCARRVRGRGGPRRGPTPLPWPTLPAWPPRTCTGELGGLCDLVCFKRDVLRKGKGREGRRSHLRSPSYRNDGLACTWTSELGAYFCRTPECSVCRRMLQGQKAAGMKSGMRSAM